MSLSSKAQESVRKERLRCAADFPYYAAEYLIIRPKRGAKVALILNRCQQYYHDKIEAQRRRTGRVRVLGLKGRQFGISTYIEGRGYHKTTHSPGWAAFILTHEDKATANLFEMAKRFHDNMHPAFKPSTGASSSKELTFPGLDSRYMVATAGTKEVGRSQTTQFFHGSEVAFWPNAENHAAGALETVPDEDDTEIHLESTANGVGNWFHKQWELAKEGKSEYIAVFIPWFWHHEYTAAVPSHFKIIDEDDKLFGNEVKIKKRYDLTDGQLVWRRRKIAKLGSLSKFKQEYPCTDVEAFQFSGRTFFDKDKIEAQLDNIMEPIVCGDLEEVNGKQSFIPRNDGWLEVFKKPEKEKYYALGVDVSEGNEDGDQNSINVFEIGDKWEQVARAAPLCQPDELGRFAVSVALFYGVSSWPWLGIERNNMGIAAVNAAEDTEYEYLFRATYEAAHDKSEQETGAFGWITNKATRPLMLSDMSAALRDDVLILHHETTIKQCGTFIRGANGKPEAITGGKDDEVISCAIAIQMILRQELEDKLDEELDDDTVDEKGSYFGGGGSDTSWMGH